MVERTHCNKRGHELAIVGEYSKGKRNAVCAECARIDHRLWRANPENKRREREWQQVRDKMPYRRQWARDYIKTPQGRSGAMKFRHGITLDEYNRILTTQNGVCKVCLQPDIDKALAVDHDHMCCPGKRSCGKCIRGLLCMFCNTAMGYAKDSPERLRKLASYLENYKVSGPVLKAPPQENPALILPRSTGDIN